MPKKTSLLNLLQLTKPYILPLGASMALLALHGSTTGAYAYLVGPLLRFIYSGGESAGSSMSRALLWIGFDPTSSPRQLTTFIATLVVALVVIKGMAYFGGSYLVARVGQQMEHSLRTTLHRHLLRISYERLAEIPHGDVISRFIGDIASLKFAVTHGMTNIIRDGLQVVILAAVAVHLDPVLGLLALCVLPLSTLAILKIGGRLRLRRRKAFDATGELAAATQQSVAALAVLRAFGAEAHADRQFSALSERVLRRNLRAWGLQIFSSPLMELLGAAALAATLWYAGARIGSGSLEPEEFVSFFAAVFMMYRPIKAIGDASAMIHSGQAALDRVNQILEMPAEPSDPPGALEPSEINRGLKFESVSFAYGDEDQGVAVLEDVSFEVPAGSTVAIVGGSGAGKTTIAMLLLRLLEPSSGRLVLDDHDLAEVSRAALRQLFALVTQDPVLLNDTIAANISFGLEADDEAIEAAARAAGAHRFATSLRQGFHTSVGEAGGRLSGGERQRICIARAVLRDPPALILDEATASVDSATEAEINASLERLMEGRTTVLISHRLSTVRRADRIVVLEQGRVMAQGSFDELAAHSAPFCRIFSDQLAVGGAPADGEAQREPADRI